MTMQMADQSLGERLAHYNTDRMMPDEAYRLYVEARSHCPVAHSDERGGFYLLMDYADVKAAHANWKTFSTTPSIMRPVAEKPPLPPLEYDPPDHTEWRKLFSEAFNPKTPEKIRDQVSADVNRLIDGFAAEGECELIADFARPIPMNALCAAIGLDRDKAPVFHELADRFIATMNKPDEFPAAMGAVFEFGVSEVMLRREKPRDDYLTWLANAELNGQLVGPPEIGMTMASLLVAGHETSINGFAGVIYEVLTRPAVRDRLVQDPSLVPAAVEEGLRLRTPFYGFFRRAQEDTTVAGVDIRKGESVQLCWAAANRDPKVFPDPAEFRLDRDLGRNRSLTFGFGIHTCPGKWAATMELELALGGLLRRLPDIELIDPDAVEFSFIGGEACAVNALPARFTPRP